MLQNFKNKIELDDETLLQDFQGEPSKPIEQNDKASQSKDMNVQQLDMFMKSTLDSRFGYQG